jgi:predicted O-methyltransferase YrrM
MGNLPPEIQLFCEQISDQPSDLCQEILDATKKKYEKWYMVCGQLEMALLRFLLKISNSSRVLEVGTFVGYSTLAMAEVLPSQGKIVTLDIDPGCVDFAKTFWNRSPHRHKIQAVIGDANDTLDSLNGRFDFAFIDADKASYPLYFEKTLNLLAPGGMIALDNSFLGGNVLNSDKRDQDTLGMRKVNEEIARRSDLQKVLLPVRDGVLLVKKK